MKKHLTFFLALFISNAFFAQNISNSVLKSDSRVYPEPYYDSIQKKTVYPTYTELKSGKVYEYNHEVCAACNPYTGEYLVYYDDLIEPIGWSKDGRFLFIIHDFGYYDNWEDEELEDEDREDEMEVHQPTTPYKSIKVSSGFSIDSGQITSTELKQFPLLINHNNGTDEIDVKIKITSFTGDHWSGQQTLAFTSNNKDDIIIKGNIQLEGCPDEVKGYLLSPDKKYLIAIFYSNYHITGAGGDPCEGSIYLKVLDIDSFKILAEKIESNVVLSDYILDPEQKDTIILIVNGNKVVKTIDEKTKNIKELIYTSDSTVNEYMANEHTDTAWHIKNPEIYKLWSKSGNLLTEKIYGEGGKIKREFYKNEGIKSEYISDGFGSLYREWDEHGQLKLTSEGYLDECYASIDYTKVWYDNGQMAEEYEYNLESGDGFYFYRSWYKNGQIKHSENSGVVCDIEEYERYLNNEPSTDTTLTFFIKNWYENGQLENEKNNTFLRCWYKDGQLKKETFYKKDNEGESILTSQQCWDKNGIKIDCSNLTSPCDPDFIILDNDE